jgi:hypothetical protein
MNKQVQLSTITTWIESNTGSILENLKESIAVYNFLQTRFQQKEDVTKDLLFQFVFRSFYRLDNAGLGAQFKTRYFELMEEFRKIHQMITFTTNHPVQWGLAQYLKERSHYLDLPNFYQKKRDYFLDGLRGSRFDFTPCQGSYFQAISYQRISHGSELDVARQFAREAGVAAIPISAFYASRLEQRALRFCFAKTEQVLEQSAAALSRI